MLMRVKTGKSDDECYTVHAPKGNYNKPCVMDNERDETYNVMYVDELIRFVRHLNIKESIRSEQYKQITDSFERALREAEDRNIELMDKLIKLEKTGGMKYE